MALKPLMTNQVSYNIENEQKSVPAEFSMPAQVQPHALFHAVPAGCVQV
jgi:hypothetical protein